MVLKTLKIVEEDGLARGFQPAGSPIGPPSFCEATILKRVDVYLPNWRRGQPAAI